MRDKTLADEAVPIPPLGMRLSQLLSGFGKIIKTSHNESTIVCTKLSKQNDLSPRIFIGLVVELILQFFECLSPFSADFLKVQSQIKLCATLFVPAFSPPPPLSPSPPRVKAEARGKIKAMPWSGTDFSTCVFLEQKTTCSNITKHTSRSLNVDKFHQSRV